MNIEFNAEFQQATKILLETNENLFITGKAGTGKSTFLKECEAKLKEKKKKYVILAPTGIAAINVGGQTIHSFFKFGKDITYSNIFKADNKHIENYQHLDTILIDEASMLRADLLDCIDKFLRINAKEEEKRNIPFAGIQMIFIGDLYQLPPVVKDENKIFTLDLPETDDEILNLVFPEKMPKKYDSPYFLSSHSLRQTHTHIIEFTKIYRQKDIEFINILNSVREGTVSQTDIEILNQRIITDIASCGKKIIKLTTKNDIADKHNLTELNKLDSKTHQEFYALKEGAIKETDYPADPTIILRVSARIMTLVNDSEGNYVNGSTGEVISININKTSFFNSTITIKLDNGKTIKLERYSWSVYESVWNEKKEEYEKVEVGSFKQYPIKLAWAITIHKSQGKTFDKAMIDLGKSGAFAAGQTYVAISRCIDIQGIYLIIPIKMKDIIVDLKIPRLIEIQKKINQLLQGETLKICG